MEEDVEEVQRLPRRQGGVKLRMHYLGVGWPWRWMRSNVQVCMCVCALGRQSDAGGKVWEGRFAGGSGQKAWAEVSWRAVPPGVGACDRGAVVVGMCAGQQCKMFHVVAPS